MCKCKSNDQTLVATAYKRRSTGKKLRNRSVTMWYKTEPDLLYSIQYSLCEPDRISLSHDFRFLISVSNKSDRRAPLELNSNIFVGKQFLLYSQYTVLYLSLVFIFTCISEIWKILCFPRLSLPFSTRFRDSQFYSKRWISFT